MRGAPSSSSTRAVVGIDVAEIVAHVELGDVADGAGQFDAGGPAADDDKIQRRMPAVLPHLPLGQFKGQQHAPANFDGVFNGLEARAPAAPTRRGQSRSGSRRWPAPGSHREAGAASQRDLPRLQRRCRPPRPSAPGVGLAAQDGADGLCDIGRRKHRQRHLVKQRLKGVVVAPVDDGYVHRQVEPAPWRREPPKPPPTMTTRAMVCRGLIERIRYINHSTSSLSDARGQSSATSKKAENDHTEA